MSALLANKVRKLFLDGYDNALDAFASSPTKSNRETVARTLFVADQLVDFAEGMRAAAWAEALEAGVVLDHKKNPQEAGISRPIYEGDSILITLTTKKPSSRIDTTKLATRLKLAFPNQDARIDALFDECKATSAVPHSFKIMLKE